MTALFHSARTIRAAALVLASALLVVAAAAPALAHDHGWREGRAGWGDDGWRGPPAWGHYKHHHHHGPSVVYVQPPPVVYAPPPAVVYAPPPAVVYAPPPSLLNVIIPIR